MEIYDMFMKNRQLLGTPSERISLLDKPTLSERAMILTIDEVRADLMREMDKQITALKNAALPECER